VLLPITIRLEHDGHAAGIGVPGVFTIQTPTVEDNHGDFPVAAGSTGAVIEVVWNGSDTLVFDVYPPCSDAGSDPVGLTAQCPDALSNQQGKSPARILVDDMSKFKDNGAGNWTIAVFNQQNPTGTAFTAISSVFYGEKPTDRYTAVKG